MITDGIYFKNFNLKKKTADIRKKLNLILDENNHIIQSLKSNYKDEYKKKDIKKFRNILNFRVIGMGGSILGTQAIYDFLKNKIYKNFSFINNLQPNSQSNKKKYLNFIVSKSGNTIETIFNSNIYIKKKDQNIFITENKDNYLRTLANKLKAKIVNHNNFIGGRYSV